jgi:hypothetical protein
VLSLGSGRGRWGDPHLLTPKTDGVGRQLVQLWQDGKPDYVRVHRLVLLAFRGPCPEGMEACHGDGNASNNALWNLRWDTHQANVGDAIGHGTKVDPPIHRGARNSRAKLTAEIVRAIRADREATGKSYQQLASQHGVSWQAIASVITKRTWTHV